MEIQSIQLIVLQDGADPTHGNASGGISLGIFLSEILHQEIGNLMFVECVLQLVQMTNFPEELKPKVRPTSNKEFQKRVWLQIYLPLILIILLVGSLVAYLWVGGVGTYSGWADTALIFLLIPVLLAGLIFFAVVAGLCYGIIYLIGWLPGPSKQGQEIMRRVAFETRRVADLVVRPFFAHNAAKSAFSKAIRHLASIFSPE